MSGPTLIARVVPRVSKSMLGKHKSSARISMARLLDGWEELISPEDPMIVRPVRIGWKKTDTGSEGTLHLAAPSALATKLKFQEAVITGRLNRLFGLPENGRVTRIAISHDKVAAPAPQARKKGKGAPSPEALKTLETIEDPVLREKLAGLAAAMEADKLA
ncbi:MAG: DUF721 domain-containing protein [Alphaproteobacteria bacterium]|nr:DUF721 domain-containing protein [Alphaproteobacteria bacterium]